MAKKEKKAAEEKAAKKEKKVMTPEEKAAKKAARMEALKQRPNSKQIDIIDLGDGNVIKNFGYPIKQKNTHIGVLVTSIAIKNGEVVSTSTSFVPGDLTVKCKKNHGTICGAKHKGAADVEDEEDDSED